VKCQFCSQPATVHLTRITDKQKKEVHLCEACAKQQNLLPAEPKPELNLPAILHLLIGQHVSPVTEELARLTCPTCGIKYMEFRGAGRLGCPDDYDAFRAGLEPILQRIHRNTRHVGKTPRHWPGNQKLQAELLELHRQLQAAVRAEHYEEAARVRDRIRERESADEPR